MQTREEYLAYHRKYNKDHYLEKKDRIIASAKKRKAELVAWLQELKKTLKCVRCGESDWRCLDFHHRKPSQKEHGVCQMPYYGYSKTRILKEIAKCDVLCANCHRKETYKEAV